MKKIIINYLAWGFVIILLVMNACGGSGSGSGSGRGKEKHIGEWKGESEGEIVSLILDKTNHAIVIIDNQVFGGEDFVVGEKKVECKYEIDYSKNPIWLDIVIYEYGKTEEIVGLMGIVRFLTDNKMEYRVNFSGEKRFENFDLEDETNRIILEKVVN